LGTALTEDQLSLLWRTAPEPLLAFDGDAAGLKAAHRAAHLALPHLKPGHSLRFAFLPSGDDPDTFLAANGSGAMQMLLEAAIPLSQLLWRAETEGKDFSTPERRAGLEQALGALVGQIGDGKIADYYRRGFEQLIFETFKRRAPQATPRQAFRPGGGQGGRFRPAPRPQPGSPEAVSASVQSSALVRKGVAGAPQAKETELGRLLAGEPRIALWEGEALAGLDLTDPSLDRLRHELLNLAASGSSLEKAGVQTHFARKGMAELLARFAGPAADDAHASFQRAALDLRQLSGGESGQTADARRLLERRKALSRNSRPDDGHGNI
jgi:DNA primase